MDRLNTLLWIQFKEFEVMDSDQEEEEEEASEDTLKSFVGNCQLVLSIRPSAIALGSVRPLWYIR
jgi:hypothetical protein